MTEIPKNYDPKTFEDKWYNFWLNNGLFESKPDSSKIPYTILQPPPNVTNMLHLGHAINNTFQDILIRYKKLQGFNTLFIPGTDHGGIATQQMVCKSLLPTTKEEIGREKFNDLIWKWKEEKSKIITDQIKKMGMACDWKREQFTLSSKLSNWVNTVFKELYDQNLIYKGKYIINYCTSCGTALSNDEIEYMEQDSKLYYIKYFLEESNEYIYSKENYIIVATTRPETIFGDVAIAFNPTDDRYKHLINRKVRIPLINRVIPIIADNYVKTDFGTGLVKITPAHDRDDCEVGKRHNLTPIDIIDKNGKIFNTNTKYDNMTTKECRERIILDLKILRSKISILRDSKYLAFQYLEKIEDYSNKISICYRCKNNVETLMSDQWFIRTKILREQALEFIEKEEIQFFPSENKEHISKWLSTDYDWCISRSIWWGHQIPIWYCSTCKHINCGKDLTTCNECYSNDLIRETDVLDTWFSSALWGFSVFDTDKEFKYYFPSNALITGSDILFFWVARMIMLTSQIEKSIPFKEVFLHGIVRDINGIKMSKSLGNGIDPITIIDEHSADILRFSMMLCTHVGLDTNIGSESFQIGKTFCTKLWNSVRYIMTNISNIKELQNLDIHNITNIDIWIINKLNILIENVEHSLNVYDFGNAARILYNFIWDDFCNCYLECAKAIIDKETTKQVLLYIIDTSLILLHPFIPFLTEELYQMIKVFFTNNSKSIMLRNWPKLLKMETEINDDLFAIHQEIIKDIRKIRSEFQIVKQETISIILIINNDILKNYIQNTAIYIKKMCNVHEILFEYDTNIKCISERNKNYTIYFPFDKRYKIDNICKNISDKICNCKLKLLKLNKNLEKAGKKKLIKFLQTIEEEKKEIENLEKQIEYYNDLRKNI